MKTSFLKLAAAVSLGCVIATPAVAENRQFQITPLVGYNFFDNDRGIDDSEFYGIALGYGLSHNWSLELSYLEGDADGQNGSLEQDITIYRLDALSDLPHFGNSAWNAYLVGGVGIADFDQEGVGERLDETQINLGIGLKTQLGSGFSLRGDVRAIDNIDQGDDQDDFGTDFAFQLALTYGFGKVYQHAAAPAPAPKPKPAPVKKEIDSDGDGVLDSADACPNTPKGVKVNSRGCPLDTDRDGVYDYLDKCPGTKPGLKVDTVGCPIKLTSAVDIQLNVNFDTNKSIVKPQYFNEIKRVADFMNQYEGTRVEVQGHTDSRGSSAYNKALSQRRADAVAAVLTREHGVASSRVTARGYGEENPIASNDNEAGRAANRRVVGSVSAQVERLERR